MEGRPRVFVESWGQSYGSPYLIVDEPDEDVATVTIQEDGEFVRPSAGNPYTGRLAFVDGVRRIEASLYQVDDGRFVRGVAGAFAAGSVVCDSGSVSFGEVEVQRLIVWGSECTTPLPKQRGGWAWRVQSVEGDDPVAPINDGLQRFMLAAEGDLAQRLSADGTVVVADGPLKFALRQDRPIVGYVKRHEKAYLPPPEHSRLSELREGGRCALFQIDKRRYSCYARLCEAPAYGPWYGIVRLEFNVQNGLDSARELADALAAGLPRYAGVAHRDPRAPQNLQPIGALENHLRRHLGSEVLAERAVREAAQAAGGRA